MDFSIPDDWEIHHADNTCPVHSPQAKRMSNALRTGGVLALTSVIYVIAQEQLDAANEKRNGYFDMNREIQDQRGQLHGPSTMILEDKNGPRLLLQLLHTIDSYVLDALILGTFGYHFRNTPHFKDRCFEGDAGSGAYIITFALAQKVHLPSSDTWNKVQEMMQRYYNGKELVAISAEEFANAREAAEMDAQFIRNNDDFDDILAASNNGSRPMVNSKSGSGKDAMFIGLFIDKFSLRQKWPGSTGQIQAPCNIGCAKNLMGRTGQHDDDSNLSKSPRTIQLLMSSLQQLGFTPEFVVHPIAKIWDVRQFSLCEAALTLMCSSMIMYGGTNQVGAGRTNHEGFAEPRFNRAKLEIMQRGGSWFAENIDRSTRLHEKRLADLDKVNTLIEKMEAFDFAKEKAKVDKVLTASYDEMIELTAQVKTRCAKITQKILEFQSLRKDRDGQHFAALKASYDAHNVLIDLLCDGIPRDKHDWDWVVNHMMKD